MLKSYRDIRNVDIVHIHHTTPPGGAAGLYFNKIKRKPLVVTHHGFEKADNYGGLLRKSLVYLSAKYFVDFLLSSASRIICISPSFINQSLFLSKYDMKTVIIPNGVDLEEFNLSIPKEMAKEKLGITINEAIVLFVGTLIPPKGAAVLINAAKEVITQLPKTRFIFVGQGTQEPELRKMAIDLAISENVVFQGFESEILRKNLFYRACDILVIPSVLSEMFPLVLLEGSAAGCAIVTSDLEIFKWFIDNNKYGLITSSGNDKELAYSIIKILQDHSLQSHLSQMAHERVLEFAWPEIAMKTVTLYRQLTGISD
jgi:glycosyltransferase involved in cell wall biosynthesis